MKSFFLFSDRIWPDYQPKVGYGAKFGRHPAGVDARRRHGAHSGSAGGRRQLRHQTGGRARRRHVSR